MCLQSLVELHQGVYLEPLLGILLRLETLLFHLSLHLRLLHLFHLGCQGLPLLLCRPLLLPRLSLSLLQILHLLLILLLYVHYALVDLDVLLIQLSVQLPVYPLFLLQVTLQLRLVPE